MRDQRLSMGVAAMLGLAVSAGCGAVEVGPGPAPVSCDLSACDAAAICVRKNGLPSCGCPDGYEDVHDDGTVCSDRDECRLGMLACGSNEVCVNLDGGAVCACRGGFVSINHVCTDVNECTGGGDDCVEPEACRNFAGGFDCACPEGFAGLACDTCEEGYDVGTDNLGRLTCTASVLDCTLDAALCSPGGSCVEAGTADHCQCQTGYDGNTCARCAAGYQDNDHDNDCSPACGLLLLACTEHAHCDDLSGVAACVCDRGWTGAACDQCATGFEDVNEDGNCVPVTCAAAELACGAHSRCFDADRHPVCLCDLGYQGTLCDACAPTHIGDGSGNCVQNLTHGAWLLAPAVHDRFGPVIAAIETATFTPHPLVALGAELHGLAYNAATDALYGLSFDYPESIVGLDRSTGASTPLYDLSSYHSLQGMTFDSNAARVRVFGTIGAGDYLIAYDPVADTMSASSLSMPSSCGMMDSNLAWGYDAAASTLRGLSGYESYQSCLFDLPLSGSTATYLRSMEPPRVLFAPGVAVGSAAVVYAAGQLSRDELGWLEAACREVAGELGADTTGYNTVLDYNHDGLNAGQLLVWSSNPTGATLFGHGSYDGSGPPDASIRIETTNPNDVACISTYEEPIDVVIAGTARFKLLVLMSSYPYLTLTIEAGFVPTTAVDPPIRAVFYSGTPDPSFTDPLKPVEVYTSGQWSALGLPYTTYYQPSAYTEPVIGTLDWSTGVLTSETLTGLTLTGGLVAY